MDETGLVRLNRERHDAVAAEYDARHPEIHNPTEQRRLSSSVSAALAAVTCANPRALDFGSGTGNLTVKLLSAGWETWAADVSPGMLALLQQRFPEAVRDGSLRTVLLDDALMAPARTPAAIIAKLNTATQEVLGAPEAREQMSRQGLEPTGGSPSDAAQHIKRETATWRRVIKEAGIKAQ